MTSRPRTSDVIPFYASPLFHIPQAFLNLKPNVLHFCHRRAPVKWSFNLTGQAQTCADWITWPRPLLEMPEAYIWYLPNLRCQNGISSSRTPFLQLKHEIHSQPSPVLGPSATLQHLQIVQMSPFRLNTLNLQPQTSHLRPWTSKL